MFRKGTHRHACELCDLIFNNINKTRRCLVLSLQSCFARRIGRSSIRASPSSFLGISTPSAKARHALSEVFSNPVDRVNQQSSARKKLRATTLSPREKLRATMQSPSEVACNHAKSLREAAINHAKSPREVASNNVEQGNLFEIPEAREDNTDTEIAKSIGSPRREQGESMCHICLVK